MTKKRTYQGKSSNQLRRHYRNKKADKFILIVVEGQKTEYHYFKSLKNDLKSNTIKVEITTSSGGDPSVVVDKAKKLITQNIEDNKRKGEPKYDEIFCVFDEDGKKDKFKEACQQSVNIENCQAIISIPCFELWFLLHYCYTASPFKDCKQLSNILESELKKINVIQKGKNYDKSNPNLYEVLKPKINNALAKSKRLAKQNEENDGCVNPSTNVYELVEKLLKT